MKSPKLKKLVDGSCQIVFVFDVDGTSSIKVGHGIALLVMQLIQTIVGSTNSLGTLSNSGVILSCTAGIARLKTN